MKLLVALKDNGKPLHSNVGFPVIFDRWFRQGQAGMKQVWAKRFRPKGIRLSGLLRILSVHYFRFLDDRPTALLRRVSRRRGSYRQAEMPDQRRSRDG